ncbi:MAG: type II toxin-antitoxin system VapB family antitoxin [Leptospiraceae bacterium]|nr:type II toxin-antitoxin system VapB family antitoxin [Leptospiraceae bacterium]
MKTSIDIPDEIMQEVQTYSQASTKREAVLVAMQEYVSRRKMAKLAASLGQFDGFISKKELDQLRCKL